CPLGDIGKTAVAILTVEAIPVGGVATRELRRLFHRVVESTAVYKKDVEQPVFVVIEQRDSATHRSGAAFTLTEVSHGCRVAPRIRRSPTRRSYAEHRFETVSVSTFWRLFPCAGAFLRGANRYGEHSRHGYGCQRRGGPRGQSDPCPH